jgi:hypothetical protein
VDQSGDHERAAVVVLPLVWCARRHCCCMVGLLLLLLLLVVAVVVVPARCGVRVGGGSAALHARLPLHDAGRCCRPRCAANE